MEKMVKGLTDVRELYRKTKEVNIASKHEAKELKELKREAPILQIELPSDNIVVAEKYRYLEELSKVVLIEQDFVDLAEIYTVGDLTIVAAKSAKPIVIYNNFFRGIKKEGRYNKFVFARPEGCAAAICHETINCKVTNCTIRRLGAQKVCFRLKELGMCKGECVECAHMEVRHKQILDAIYTTRGILSTTANIKGLCGKDVCKEGLKLGCPNGCRSNN